MRSFRAAIVVAALFATTAQAQEPRKPAVAPPPGAPKPTLIVTASEAEGLSADAQKALAQAASAFAKSVEGVRYDVTSFVDLAAAQGCMQVDTDCVKKVARALDAITVARIEAAAGKNDVTVVVTVYGGASGTELKKASRGGPASDVGSLVTSALEEATGKKAAPPAAPAAASGTPAGAVREIEASVPLEPIAGVTPAPAVQAQAPAAAMKKSPLRLQASFGLGRAAESGAAEGQSTAEFSLGGYFTLVDHLLLGIELGQQVYDRHYLTDLPGTDGTGSLAVDVHERVLEARLNAGYNLLRFAVPDARVAHAAPFAEIRVVRYENNVAPQTLLSGGAGLRAGVRLSDALSVEGEFVYGFNLLPYMSAALKKEVDDLLAFGNMIGSMRYGGGVLWQFTPMVRGSLRYQGEWLALQQASRFTDGLHAGVVVDL